jgi:hypothetical protein
LRVAPSRFDLIRESVNGASDIARVYSRDRLGVIIYHLARLECKTCEHFIAVLRNAQWQTVEKFRQRLFKKSGRKIFNLSGLKIVGE